MAPCVVNPPEVRDIYVDIPDLKLREHDNCTPLYKHGFHISHTKGGTSFLGSMQVIPEEGLYSSEDNPCHKRALELLEFILAGEGGGDGDFQSVPQDEVVSPSNDPKEQQERAFVFLKEALNNTAHYQKTVNTSYAISYSPKEFLQETDVGKDGGARCEGEDLPVSCAPEGWSVHTATKLPHGTIIAAKGCTEVAVQVAEAPQSSPGHSSPGGKPWAWAKVPAYGAFAMANAVLLSIPIASGFAAAWPGAIAIWSVGCFVVLALLAFNLYFGTHPRLVVNALIHRSKQGIVEGTRGVGQVVTLKGFVSCVPGTKHLLSSEVRAVSSCVLVETVVRGCREGCKQQSEANHGQRAQATRAVDFMLTDRVSGKTVLVQAADAAKEGAITCWLPRAPPLALREGQKVLGADWCRLVGWETNPSGASTGSVELAALEKYIRPGQEVAVMGALHDGPSPGSYSLRPICGTHNLTLLPVFWSGLPYFFPTWVTGLVISDHLG